MDKWAAIRYRDFYDVPRIFVVSHEGRQFLFDCAFDDELDDYPDSYRVYLLPPVADVDLEGSWERLPQLAKEFLGVIGVSQVQFDPTKREAVNLAVIEKILAEPSFILKVA